jgi:uncharacterized protein (DUF1778 family)
MKSSFANDVRNVETQSQTVVENWRAQEGARIRTVYPLPDSVVKSAGHQEEWRQFSRHIEIAVAEGLPFFALVESERVTDSAILVPRFRCGSLRFRSARRCWTFSPTSRKRKTAAHEHTAAWASGRGRKSAMNCLSGCQARRAKCCRLRSIQPRRSRSRRIQPLLSLSNDRDATSPRARSFWPATELKLTSTLLCISCVQKQSHAMATATAQIHLRTPPKTKSLLTLAAELSGATNLTDYILRAAVERARADLSNQQTFALKKGQWNEFAKRLEAPPRKLPRLRKLLKEPDVFRSAAAST